MSQEVEITSLMLRRREDPVYIYAGRFQPFHLGHMSVVSRTLETGNTPLVIGVIINTVKSGAALTEAARRVSEYGDVAQDPEKNPLDPLTRVSLIRAACIAACFEDKVTVTVIPRPERHWEMIQQLFRAPRCWILPDKIDSFDSLKADFYQEQGDKVVRAGVNPLTSGTLVRSRLAQGLDVSDLVPGPVAAGLHYLFRDGDASC